MDISDAVIVKSSRLKSVVWNDFDRVRKDDTYVAICRHCKKKLSGSSASGTSHLRNHLIRCRRRANLGIAQCFSGREKKKEGILALVNVDQDQKKDEVLGVVNLRCDHDQVKDDAVTIASASLDQRRSRFDLARMIILHSYPLNMVEHIGFRVFIKNLQPLFEFVTFDRVESDCMEIYAKEKQKVFEVLDKLPGKISVGVDVWKGLDEVEFLCLTAYYINDAWELKKRILNFFLVDASNTKDILSEVIVTCLMEWDIDRKLFSMTSDHYPPFSEDIAEKIRDRLSQNKFLYCNGQLFDVHCAMNVINQMVQNGLESCNEMIYKVWESIRYVKCSEAMQMRFNQLAVEALQESQDHCQKLLSLDNPGQWNTTCNMLETALEYRAVFCLLKEKDPTYLSCPTDIEWERLGTITGFFKFFLDIANVFTGSKNLTASMYFPEICEIHLKLIEWCKNPDDFISTVAANMRKKFDEYWDKCNLCLAVAAMLDPRFKMKLIEYYYAQLYGASSSELIDDVFECIKGLHNECSIGSPLASSDQGLAWQVSEIAEKDRDKLIGYDKYVHETTLGQESKSDLDKYLEEPLFPRHGDFDILNWWKVHTPRYPILSMMARNILAIPMSKVASESAFDSGRKMLNHHWCSLRPSTVQALMCAQDWIKSELES